VPALVNDYIRVDQFLAAATILFGEIEYLDIATVAVVFDINVVFGKMGF
jgi:hypothetical protein